MALSGMISESRVSVSDISDGEHESISEHISTPFDTTLRILAQRNVMVLSVLNSEVWEAWDTVVWSAIITGEGHSCVERSETQATRPA